MKTLPLFNLPRHDMAVATPQKNTASGMICKADIKLQEAMPSIQQGMDYPYASGGDWSTHDLIKHLLQFTGPAHLHAATWSVSDAATQTLVGLCRDGLLLSIRMLVDWRVQVRTPGFLAIARQEFADVRVSSCHAKCFVLHNQRWCVSCVGSANFTGNPRIEAGHISTSSAVGDFHRRWIESEIKNAAPFGIDMRKVGKPDGRK